MHHPHSVSIWLEAAYNPSITNQTRLELWVIESRVPPGRIPLDSQDEYRLPLDNQEEIGS
jgi:hypothetical protein